MIDLYRFTLLLERCIRLNDRRIIEFLSSRELTKSIDREEEERGEKKKLKKIVKRKKSLSGRRRRRKILRANCAR